jgi:hypothetical protein
MLRKNSARILKGALSGLFLVALSRKNYVWYHMKQCCLDTTEFYALLKGLPRL